jgi:hypothetical protein
LVQSLADSAWRLNRVSVLETNLLTHDIVYQDFPNHESTLEMQEAIAIAAALDSHAKVLATLSLHGQRLSRQFEKTVALLRELQTKRLAHELDQSANLVKLHRKNEEPYHPFDDGFVFSEEEIDPFISHHNRDQPAFYAEGYCFAA